MKKIAIIYASKTETTMECAKKLQKEFEDADLFRVEDKPNLSEYQCLIMGSYIHLGMMNKKFLAMLDEKKDVIAPKKIAFFTCNVLKENEQVYFEKNIDPDLLKKAITYQSLGGRLDSSKAKGMDKLFINMGKKVIKGNCHQDLSDAKIKAFAKEIKDAL